MLFIAGPRQVGKTTLSLAIETFTNDFYYFNWDVLEHRNLILTGVLAIAERTNLNALKEKLPIIVFDEIHKYAHWKTFLKGFYDLYQNKTHIIVTGSSRLDIFRRGGDSLMGRYFIYHIHPLSISECVHPQLADHEIKPPSPINQEDFNALWKFGGFPEPFLKRNARFHTNWKRILKQQLFKEDIRDLSHIQEIGLLEIFGNMLNQQASQLLNLSSLASKMNVSVNTIKRWLIILENFYFCFSIKPWSKNVTRSLIKEPKLYLWDWSEIDDIGQRAENFIASHLLKAVQYWNDTGLGHYGLYFIRDKEKREVDFLVTKNKQPWFLVEAKYSNNQSINEALYRFQKELNVAHAFQVVIDMEYVNADCFKEKEPIIVPAQTFLSQLI